MRLVWKLLDVIIKAGECSIDDVFYLYYFSGCLDKKKASVDDHRKYTRGIFRNTFFWQTSRAKSAEHEASSVYRITTSITVPAESTVRATTFSVEGRRWEMAHEEAINVIIVQLWECELKGIVVKTKRLAVWKSAPLPVRKYCGISKRTCQQCDLRLLW